ncbi:TonB-dependent receptor [Sphingomonas psychrotolerans]|uniref:TonB-dependent receptor n=1 Tax=Sphingomonas psychrotolerans TaxID=1327635 RepID=A0ABU3N052_9SPHN|nr:TonB-dependent receptor [Sphingomonas psychrotolerans]MDT8757239.1 TonB-dependent receptor [Sphingomonas psychrotolerans]
MVASPALAQERAAEVDIGASRLDVAIKLLSRQTGSSIGFRDSGLSTARTRPVRGRFTASQALERMLLGSQIHARRVAPATYLLEQVAEPAVAGRPRPSRSFRPIPEAAPEPDEIVVTATKRDIPLGAYPGGVQIVDGEALSAADGLRGTEAIEARIASVASTHLGPGRNKLFIRGIADSSFVGPTQSTVGQYWGNSRITYSAPDPNLRLYDVKSVEVLEGPQGTLYGAGSLGGVVRVVPRSPDLRSVEGSAWGGVLAVQHGKPGMDGGAIFNLPLKGDVIGLRALAFGSVEGGYIDDVARGVEDINRVRTFGGRAALRVDPGDDWTIDLNAVGQRIDGDDSQYAERSVGELDRASGIAQPFRNDYWLVDLVARKNWGSLELTSSLGYAGQYVFERFEGPKLADAASPGTEPLVSAPMAAYSQANRISMVTGEVRLARHGINGTGWLLAASLLHNRAQTNRRMEVAPFDMPLTGVNNQVEEATLYGEATIEPVDRFTLTFGGRLTHARLSGSSEDVAETVAFRIDPGARASRSETRFLPSIAAAYRAADRLTLFARYQQGFRPGGIAVRREYIQRFAGDRVSTLETGARYRSPSLDLAVSASATRWSNIQADLIDGFGFPTTANAGDGRVFSLGMVSRWRPVVGLELDAALYLNDSKVTERAFVILPTELATAGIERLPNVADASGRLGFAYSESLASDLEFTANGYARYVGKSTLGIGPILGRLQGDYLDTGVEVRIGKERRGVSIAVTNLLDARGNRFALGSPFLIRDRDQTTPLRPRTVRFGFDLHF